VVEITFTDQLTKITSQKQKPEVGLQCHGRHLEKSIWHHNSNARGRPIQNNISLTTETSRPKPEVEFQYGCLQI